MNNSAEITVSAIAHVALQHYLLIPIS